LGIFPQTGKEIKQNATSDERKLWDEFKPLLVNVLLKERSWDEFKPLLVNVLYILPFFLTPDAQFRVIGVALVAVTGFFWTMRFSKGFRKKISGKDSEKSEHLRNLRVAAIFRLDSNGRDSRQGNDEAKKRFTLFFGMIYVFVAALSISEALDTFNDEALVSMLSSNSMSERDLSILLTLIAFFVTAIPFVHAGVIYLATEATAELTEGDFSLVLQNFTVLFLQVVLLSFMAFNIANIDNFIKLAIALMLIDIIWVIRFRFRSKFRFRFRKRSDHEKKKKDDLVYIEWLHFNSIAALFLITALLIEQSLYTSLLIFPVLFARTFCDYKSLWDIVYSKRILENF
jgi:hypothetical protein